MSFWFISYWPFTVISTAILAFTIHISLGLIVVAEFIINTAMQHLEQPILLVELLYDSNRFSWIELVN